jgi:hypothetical protein
VLFGLALAAATFIAITWSLVVFKRAQLQVRWEIAQGRILFSDVDYWGGSTQPRVEYTYTYNGETFWNNKIWTPEVALYFPDGARRVVMRFPVDASVGVFVNPADAKKAVLIPGGDRKFLPSTVVLATFSFFIAASAILKQLD